MSSGKRRFFSGPSLDAALMRAARFHRVEPEKLLYRKLEKRHGFLKIRRGIVIEVDPEAPLLEADAGAEVAGAGAEVAGGGAEVAGAGAEVAGGGAEVVGAGTEVAGGGVPSAPQAALRPPVPPEGGVAIDEETAAVAREGLIKILEVAGLDLESRVGQGEEELQVELRGPDEELLVAERGALLLSIQHLLPRVIRGLAGRGVPCRVDCASFHESRRERLSQLAERSASEVRRRLKPRTLEPMAPDERRIIHLVLADNPDVVTESEGRGYFKRVTIRPAQNRPRGFDR